MMRARRSKDESATFSPTPHGNLAHAVLRTADIKGRDGAQLALAKIINRFPWLRHVFADGGYAGDLLRQAPRSQLTH